MVHHLEVNGSTRINGTLLTTGNVGIGNTNPPYQLSLGTHLISGGDGILYIGKNTGNGSSRFFTIRYNAGYDMCFSDMNNKDIFRISHSAPIDTLVINGSGNVGIGTANPQRKLHIVSGNPQLLLETGNASGGVIHFGNSGHGVGRDTGISYFTNGNDVALWTAGNGHCGLRISGGGLRLLSDGSTQFENERWHGSVNDGLGRVYYGTNTTTFYKGYDGVPHTWRRGNDVSIASLTENGNMRAAAFTVFSDERIKKDIVDIDDEIGLQKILLVEPKTYNILMKQRVRTP